MSKYLRLMGLYFSSAIFIVLIGLVTTVAWMPPSEAQDDVCDGLEGDAYGLCNAYCVAMDCDSEEHKAPDMACEHVLRNFQRISTASTLPDCDPCGYLVPRDQAESFECPCPFDEIPKLTQCWTLNQLTPSFVPCQTPSCSPFDPIRPICRLTIFFTANILDESSIGVINGTTFTSCQYISARCNITTVQSYFPLSPEQVATCFCRAAEYTNALAQVDGIVIQSTQTPPYSCDPTQ